ncbi:hypothetical protein FRX31_011114 [Thalictrum thalictroides]|uniref:Uncharacterized protein n=1 Tax=Thalictrum thalictroides TaxID=46969 RepID=A0A7J6WPK1_THATH|nr:hypothetical protein FRX31_011114 [Thalictrum thalictroides]
MCVELWKVSWKEVGDVVDSPPPPPGELKFENGPLLSPDSTESNIDTFSGTYAKRGNYGNGLPNVTETKLPSNLIILFSFYDIHNQNIKYDAPFLRSFLQQQYMDSSQI